MKSALYSLLILLVAFSACTDQKQEGPIGEAKHKTEVQEKEVVITDSTETTYSYKTNFTEEHGWGYVIYNNDKPYINQPHIPAVPGNKGFSTKEKAEKTADFILHKLNNQIFPPSVTKAELDSLGVL